ncbi:hypothetical protein LMG18090_01294 [Ralstonia mannitolilytica]|nr:hypothetical protein LMG18090_01294 [Ralstonia mannitolilytica]
MGRKADNDLRGQSHYLRLRGRCHSYHARGRSTLSQLAGAPSGKESLPPLPLGASLLPRIRQRSEKTLRNVYAASASGRAAARGLEVPTRESELRRYGYGIHSNCLGRQVSSCEGPRGGGICERMGGN